MKNCLNCGAICADNSDKCPACEARARQPAAEPAAPAVCAGPGGGRCWKAALLSVFWCGAGQFFKGELLKGFLVLPVNLLFYAATFFAMVGLGDYEHPGAAAKVLPFYGKVLCFTAPVWAWNIVDAMRARKRE